ncbi:MAG: hypothetical protein KAS72_07700 [Phycisphaerales bacterium]|nr:hypothetical protein [Phycisphaerales bacterium]
MTYRRHDRVPWRGSLDGSAAVEVVRGALHDGRLVIVGGDRREHHIQRIRSAFGLAEVHWAQTRKTDASLRRIRTAIEHPNTDLVVLLCGLIRHQHARDVPRLCEAHGKLLVRYWRNPHPHGLANAIIDQVGNRLGLRQTV